MAVQASRWPPYALQAADTPQAVANTTITNAPIGPALPAPAKAESLLPLKSKTATNAKPAVANATSTIRRDVNAGIFQPVRGGHQIPGKRRSLVSTLKDEIRGRGDFGSLPRLLSSAKERDVRGIRDVPVPADF